MPNETCHIEGQIMSGKDIYKIDKFHSKDSIKLLYNVDLDDNVYMCTSSVNKNMKVQPTGSIYLDNNDKIEITSDYTGELIILFQYFDVLRVMNGMMGFAYDAEISTTEDININNLVYQVTMNDLNIKNVAHYN